MEKGDIFIPEDVVMDAYTAVRSLVPEKSACLYEKEYKTFCEWRKRRNVKGVNEDIVLAYLSEKVIKCKPSSLWSYHSMLKKTLCVNENVDIGCFAKVKAFLKVQSDGFKSKKSGILTREQIDRFLKEADDDVYLLEKVVLVMGIFGACRVGELLKMSIDDVSDRGNVLVVTVSDTKTKQDRIFTIINEDDGSLFDPIQVYRKYVGLRPNHALHRRLFIDYKDKKCTTQPVGINKLGKIPMKIAGFLGLPDPHIYTGHCLRRSSASLLAESGGDLLAVKRLGGWSSSKVAEGHIEDSILKKVEDKEKDTWCQNQGPSTSVPAVKQLHQEQDNQHTQSQSHNNDSFNVNLQPSSSLGLSVKRHKTSETPPPVPVRVKEALNKLDRIIVVARKQCEQTEFDVWAKSLAMQLNNMELRRALALQLQIQTLVSNERLEYEKQKHMSI